MGDFVGKVFVVGILVGKDAGKIRSNIFIVVLFVGLMNVVGYFVELMHSLLCISSGKPIRKG